MNLPNKLTMFRIGLIPVLVLLFYLPFRWTMFAAAAIFAIGAITDIVDGYVARSRNLTSELGAFLDPVADKLMVTVALALLIQSHASLWMTIPATVIICREILVSALREWMGTYGSTGNMSVAFVGKVKTTLQMLSIIGLLANPPGVYYWLPDPGNYDWLLLLAYALLYASFFLTLWSLVHYLKMAWPDLTSGR
ncbi:MAG: CDP-diacylglycerol--glycerol-3-phosphate 3-phosphatidyltransferase [Gammaproteobacteria bacterium]|nr:MAG: CDP-diacylglycerol--glycerol-3-phosphate 3-phosphatidyltransferase [Gammaproteobacteria bacterium]